MTDEQLLHKIADIIYDNDMSFDYMNLLVRKLLDDNRPGLFKAVQRRQKESKILDLKNQISKAQKEIDALQNS